MINKTREQIIRVAAVSALLVLLVAFFVVYMLVHREEDRSVDVYTDLIAENGGILTEEDAVQLQAGYLSGDGILGNYFDGARYLDAETAMAARYFTVRFPAEGEPVVENIGNVAFVDDQAAKDYALSARKAGAERGWEDDFRYKRFEEDGADCFVFLNGARTRELARYFIFIAMIVMVLLELALLGLLLFFSKWAIRPIAEGYEKQRRFVTNINHELKTPLTLILTNSEILEQEGGGNEWVTGIREEAQEMNRMINQLVDLSRLEESGPDRNWQFTAVDLTQLLTRALAEFKPLFDKRELTVKTDLEPGVCIRGNEALLHRLAVIQLDNAVKYCDPGGDITVTLKSEHGAVLCIENTYADIGRIEPERLFERFYREDPARTAGEGHGIGLSFARSIARVHGGSLTACQAGVDRIRFRTVLKK